jgi:hypothetical protein
MQYPKCVLFAPLLATISISASAQTSTYTNSSLKGNYIFTETGLPGPGGAIASIGVLTADGNGGVTGTLTQRRPGQFVVNRSASGQYQIHQDGSGTLQLSAASAVEEDTVTRRYQIVIAKSGVSGISTDDGLFGSLALAQQAAGASTLAALKGRYSFSETGTVNQSAHVGVGTLELDGTGAVTGSLEFRTLGRSAVTQRVSGTYSVSAAGLGEITVEYTETTGPSDDPEMQVNRLRFAFAVTSQGLVAVRLDSGVSAVSHLALQ